MWGEAGTFLRAPQDSGRSRGRLLHERIQAAARHLSRPPMRARMIRTIFKLLSVVPTTTMRPFKQDEPR